MPQQGRISGGFALLLVAVLLPMPAARADARRVGPAAPRTDRTATARPTRRALPSQAPARRAAWAMLYARLRAVSGGGRLMPGPAGVLAGGAPFPGVPALNAGGSLAASGFAPPAPSGPGTTFVPGTANTGGRHRYRGSNTDVITGGAFGEGAAGWTGDDTAETFYWPGYGANGGFPAPERIVGGYHLPGYGVIFSGGLYNQPGAVVQNLAGGTYLPGFGFIPGGADLVGVPVEGGLYIPGLGVLTPSEASELRARGIPVEGGVYIPGLGVVHQ
jgi:hypothetical protein